MNPHCSAKATFNSGKPNPTGMGWRGERTQVLIFAWMDPKPECKYLCSPGISSCFSSSAFPSQLWSTCLTDLYWGAVGTVHRRKISRLHSTPSKEGPASGPQAALFSKNLSARGRPDRGRERQAWVQTLNTETRSLFTASKSLKSVLKKPWQPKKWPHMTVMARERKRPVFKECKQCQQTFENQLPVNFTNLDSWIQIIRDGIWGWVFQLKY